MAVLIVHLSDRDKGLVQALEETFSRNHSTHCSIHIQRNVQTKFCLREVSNDINKIARTFSTYQESKMIKNIEHHSVAVYDFLFGEDGIEANKWRSTEWIKEKTLPTRYGIG
jgi:Transposase, Mutator family